VRLSLSRCTLKLIEVTNLFLGKNCGNVSFSYGLPTIWLVLYFQAEKYKVTNENMKLIPFDI
jgi:hypothetical protein